MLGERKHNATEDAKPHDYSLYTKAAFSTPALDELQRLEHPVSASSNASLEGALKKQKNNNATSTTEYIKTPEVITVLLPVPTHMPINNIIPEVGIDRLPDNVQSICIEYAAEPNIEEKKSDPKIQVQYSPMAFFNKNLARRLFDAANALHHDGIIVPALNLVRDEGSRILEYETTCIDRFDRCLREKTLIQIAGMGGDVDYLQKYIPYYSLNFIKQDTPALYKYKKHGAVELLAEAGGLTNGDVAKQLYPVLFSSEAVLENNIRKQRILDVFIAFGERILAKKDAVLASGHIRAAQRICREDIDRLKDDVMCTISHENLTKGQVLDPHIMIELHWWYWHDENQLRFENGLNNYTFKKSLLSDLFWLHTFGMLQYIATPSDARIYLTGICAVYRNSKYQLAGDAVFNEPIARTLKNVDEFSHFYPPSRLGLDYCLDEKGKPSDYFSIAITIERIEELCKAKEASLKKFNTVSEQLAHYFCLR